MSVRLKSAPYVASAVGICLANPSLAFEISIPPVTTGGTGYLFPNGPSDLDRYLTSPDVPISEDSGQREDDELRCKVDNIPQAEIEALQQQYPVQVKTHGKDHADRWVHEATTQLFHELALQGLC